MKWEQRLALLILALSVSAFLLLAGFALWNHWSIDQRITLRLELPKK
jgi:hypothetical protein